MGLELSERVARRDGPSGARRIAGRLADPELSPVEAEFRRVLGAAFTELEGEARETPSTWTAPGGCCPTPGSETCRGRQAAHRPGGRAQDLLGMLRSALDQRSVFFWIGDENPQPELRSVSVVGANYGLGHRNLGTVGVVGPLRMDYATAIASVRGAARELSRYCETVYGGVSEPDAPRLLRGARGPAGCEPGRGEDRLSPSRPRAAP